MSEEIKTEEKIEEKRKGKFNFKNWLKGKSRKEHWENMSFTIIIFSAILIFIGLLLGSFVKYTIFMASFGSFFVMIGIIIYIFSEFIEEVK